MKHHDLIFGGNWKGQPHPIGSKYSPNYYKVALRNYGRILNLSGFGVDDSYPGLKLSCNKENGMIALTIDQRGPGLTRIKAKFPFSSLSERRDAFRMAKALFTSISEVERGRLNANRK